MRLFVINIIWLFCSLYIIALLSALIILYKNCRVYIEVIFKALFIWCVYFMKTKRILFIVNVDTFFISHRLPIALAAINAGCEVHLACLTSGEEYTDRLTSHGIIVHSIPLSRAGISLFQEIKSFLSIYNIIKSVNPDVLHLVTAKPVTYGGIINKLFFSKKCVVSISGLGYIFIDNKITVKFLRFIIVCAYRFSLNNKNTHVIFQNNDDRSLFSNLSIVSDGNSSIVRGSGVNLNNYMVMPNPAGIPIVVLVSRLLYDKGVREFVDAANILRARKIPVRMVLVGDVDKNPNSVKKNEIESWVCSRAIEYWGFRSDIGSVMGLASIVALPSYREGLPKCLIEAAACGRAVITTDVPGCKDAIINNRTGLLVPVKNHLALADAIEYLVLNPNVRAKMGVEGRKLAEEYFDISLVINEHMRLYNLR